MANRILTCRNEYMQINRDALLSAFTRLSAHHTDLHQIPQCLRQRKLCQQQLQINELHLYSIQYVIDRL